MDTRTNHYGFYWHAQNNKEQIKQCPGKFRCGVEGKEGQQHVLGEHMMAMYVYGIRDSYAGRILDTRFEATTTTLNLGSIDMEMELDSYDMKW